MTPATSDNIARSVGHSHGYVVGCLHALIQTGSIVAGEYRYSGAYYDGSEMHPCYILKPRAADVLMACIEGRMASPVHRPGREPRPAAKRSTSRRASMKELIPIQQKEVSGQQIKTVNARELHSFLESKQHFADWIKGRIINFDFMEGADFITIHNSMTSPPTKEYHLTLDMAKELSMVERNARGEAGPSILHRMRAGSAATPGRPSDPPWSP